MKKAVLDTNFILICVKERIDFFEDISFKGFKIVIPEEVFGEIERLAKEGKKLHTRDNASLALKIIRGNNFELLKLGDSNVDRGLLNLSKEDKDTTIATIDRALKYKIKRPVLVIRGKKKIELI